MTGLAPLYAALAVVFAATATGYFAYRSAKRATSGGVDTSAAASLWDESAKMRSELRDEVVALKAQLTEAITVVTTLNREITHQRQETEAAREETRKSREETRTLMAQIDELHGETKGVLDEVRSANAETKGVLKEVQTANALTMGQLADNQETRRITVIPQGDRTTQEQEHLDTAAQRMPDDLRAQQPADPEPDPTPEGGTP